MCQTVFSSTPIGILWILVKVGWFHLQSGIFKILVIDVRPMREEIINMPQIDM